MASKGRWADRIELIGAFGGALATALVLRFTGNVSLPVVFFATLSIVFLSGRFHGWLGRRIGFRLDRAADTDAEG